MDGVLVTQPVRTLDCVVHVPSPVILVHAVNCMSIPTLVIAKSCRHSLSESGVDTTLGGDSVRSGGEQLRDTGGVEASLSQTEGGSQTSATGTDDEGIVFVVNDGVLVAEERRSLLCAKGLVCDDTGSGCAAREGASLLSSKALRELPVLSSATNFPKSIFEGNTPLKKRRTVANRTSS